MQERLSHPTPADAYVEIDVGAISIDAKLVGRGLDLAASEVVRLMREGAITGICEHGVDHDAGRYRLTFFHKGRRLRLVADSSGKVLQHSTIDFGNRPLPASLHRPGD